MKKYKMLENDTIKSIDGTVLCRIQSLRVFAYAQKGDLGGYIEKEENLSHDGNARVYGNARVHDDARVYGDARVHGDAEISKTQDYLVFKNNWSSGRYFTYTFSNNMWKVGCFYGIGEELVRKAYQDSQLSGDMYSLYVGLVENMKAMQL